MSLNQLETQALDSIADGPAGSDPRLASMLNIFSRLAGGEEMPAREKREQLGHTRAVTRPPAAVPRADPAWRSPMRTIGCPASIWRAGTRPAVTLAGRRRSVLLVTLNLAAAGRRR